jgi:hypothetical protein
MQYRACLAGFMRSSPSKDGRGDRDCPVASACNGLVSWDRERDGLAGAICELCELRPKTHAPEGPTRPPHLPPPKLDPPGLVDSGPQGMAINKCVLAAPFATAQAALQRRRSTVGELAGCAIEEGKGKVANSARHLSWISPCRQAGASSPCA